MVFISFKVGIMEEMLDDTLDMEGEEELEEEADAEVDKVLFEITNGKLGEAGTVTAELPVRNYFISCIATTLTPSYVNLVFGRQVAGRGYREEYGEVS